MLYRNRNLFLHFQHGIIHRDHVYAVSGDNDTPADLKCLNLATGDVLWSNRYGGAHRGNVLLLGAHLLVLTENGELILIDPSPGGYRELHRIQAMPKTCWTPPACADGLLYCRNNDGDVRCYDLK
jgi:outer membrane protein assembly factor BamB